MQTRESFHMGSSVVEYVLTRSQRAKRVRLIVRHDGTVSVAAPHGTDLARIKQFVHSKAAWIVRKIREAAKVKERHPNRVYLKGSKREYALLKQDALRLVHDRLKYFNQHYRFTYHEVRIKNQGTRWGSCSRRGNLNFNYLLMRLPPHLMDYIIVHELCHLREMNHGPRFWALVAKTFPKYLELKQELRQYVQVR